MDLSLEAKNTKIKTNIEHTTNLVGTNYYKIRHSLKSSKIVLD